MKLTTTTTAAPSGGDEAQNWMALWIVFPLGATISLSFWLGNLATNLLIVRAHRQSLVLISTGLFLITIFSAIESAKFMQPFCRHILIGPVLASLSFSRLLLYINCATSSRLSTYLTSKFAYGLHLVIGPVLGVLRQAFVSSSTNTVSPLTSEVTLDGLETLWDLGSCFMCACLWLLLRLNPGQKRAKKKRKRPTSLYHNTSGNPFAVNSRCFYVATYDGFLPSNVASFLVRLTLVAYQWSRYVTAVHPELSRNHNHNNVTVVTVFGIVIPLILMTDIKRKITAFISKCFHGNSSRNVEVFHTSLADPTQTTQIWDDNFKRDHQIPKSVSYSGGVGRCALGSILKCAPSLTGVSFKQDGYPPVKSKAKKAVPRTKTWSGPLDDALAAMVGQKHSPTEEY